MQIPINIPTHESDVCDATCPLSLKPATSYPVGGDYYILDSDACGGPYWITGRSVAILRWPSNRGENDEVVKKMISVLRGWKRNRYWESRKELPAICSHEKGFKMSFRDQVCLV